MNNFQPAPDSGGRSWARVEPLASIHRANSTAPLPGESNSGCARVNVDFEQNPRSQRPLRKGPRNKTCFPKPPNPHLLLAWGNPTAPTPSPDSAGGFTNHRLTAPVLPATDSAVGWPWSKQSYRDQ